MSCVAPGMDGDPFADVRSHEQKEGEGEKKGVALLSTGTFELTSDDIGKCLPDQLYNGSDMIVPISG